MAGTANDLGRVVLYAGVIIVLLVWVLSKKRQRRQAAMSMDGPILSSEGMLAADGLTSIGTGELAGFTYNLMTNATGRVMFFVELGHDTGVHLLGFGNASRLGDEARAMISRKWLQPVSLEGDFSQYFYLYATPGRTMELLEVFTPDIMAEFADFCRAYDFEIFRESLYISQAAGATDAQDSTTLTTDITAFLQRQGATLRRL